MSKMMHIKIHRKWVEGCQECSETEHVFTKEFDKVCYELDETEYMTYNLILAHHTELDLDKITFNQRLGLPDSVLDTSDFQPILERLMFDFLIDIMSYIGRSYSLIEFDAEE